MNNASHYHEILAQISIAKINYQVLLIKLREKSISQEEEEKLQAIGDFFKDLVTFVEKL